MADQPMEGFNKLQVHVNSLSFEELKALADQNLDERDTSEAPDAPAGDDANTNVRCGGVLPVVPDSTLGMPERVDKLPRMNKPLAILQDITGIINTSNPRRVTPLEHSAGSGKRTLLFSRTNAGDIHTATEVISVGLYQNAEESSLIVMSLKAYVRHEANQFIPQRTASYIWQYRDDHKNDEIKLMQTPSNWLIVPNLSALSEMDQAVAPYGMLTELRMEEKTTIIKPHTDRADVYMKLSEMGGKEDNVVTNDCTFEIEIGLPGVENVEQQKTWAAALTDLSSLKIFLIENGLSEHLSSLKVFLVSCFYAALLPNITNHKDASHDAYVIIFTGFMGLCFSVIFLQYPCSPPKFDRVKKIEPYRYIDISCMYVCFVILASIPCLALFLNESLYALFALYPISIIMLVATSLPKQDTITTDNKTHISIKELLSLAFSNNILSVGAIVVVFLCSSTKRYPSNSTYNFEFDLSLVLFFHSNMFGLSAILNLLFPLMRNCHLSEARITITEYLVGLSAFLLVSAEICFASPMLEVYKLYLLITPVPSVAYLAVEWKHISARWTKQGSAHKGIGHARAPAGDVCKEFNTFVTLNFGVLMAVLQAYATSTWAFKGSSFHLFVILSLIVLFSLQFIMLLAVLMPPEEEGMMDKYMLNIIMGLLQVVAIGCLGLS